MKEMRKKEEKKTWDEPGSPRQGYWIPKYSWWSDEIRFLLSQQLDNWPLVRNGVNPIWIHTFFFPTAFNILIAFFLKLNSEYYLDAWSCSQVPLYLWKKK